MIKTIWKYNKTFEEAIEDDLNDRLSDKIHFYTASKHFVRKGFYYKQIVELFKWFPRYNVLILLEEEILKDKDKEFKKISNFLNVDYSKFTEIIINDNRQDIKIEKNMYDKLINIYKDDILKLENLLNIKTNWI
jgi:hypothetical protein